MATRTFVVGQEYDVAIIGAGPVGLALASELARMGLSTIVVDRRPPLTEDAWVRPQLLVARRGDLANLVHLGVDVRDPDIVTLLASRIEADHTTVVRGEVARLRGEPVRAFDLWELAAQPPLALVPIGRLQAALVERAQAHGATVHYACDVVRVRRHARLVSLVCADGTSLQAGMVVIATGAARPLLPALEAQATGSAQRMIAGMFAAGERGQWIRAELAVPGLARAARCTILQTRDASAVLVAPQVAGVPSSAQLAACYAAAAAAYGLAGTAPIRAPMEFDTTVTTSSVRYLAGDQRAPVIVAGDAAQTGHVFSGQTCFINLALVLELAEQLAAAKRAIVNRKVSDAQLLHALAVYARESEVGAAILARISQRHYRAHGPGAWAHAGIARAG